MTRSRLIACGATALLLTCSASAAERLTFGMIPPEAARAIAAQRAPEEAKQIIAQATGYLAMQPKAQAVITVAGVLQTNDFYTIMDWAKMLGLAVGYRLTNDRRFLDQADKFMNAWLDTFNLAQKPIVVTAENCTAPPSYPIRGAGTKCLNPVDDFYLVFWIMGYDVAQADLPAATRRKMQRFMRHLAEGYLRDMDLRRPSTDRWIKMNVGSNWQSFRVELATLGAFITGDPALIERARLAYQELIERNLVYEVRARCANGQYCMQTVNDGSSFDFHHRDALRYAIGAIEPLVDCAVAAQAHGQDWYHYVSPKGASLVRAMAWFVPYAAGEKTHEEFARTSVGFDKQRAKQWKGYSGQWDPQGAKNMFRKAVHLDPKLRTPGIEALMASPYATVLYDSLKSPHPQQPIIGFLYR
jgi:hypothetical protein